MVIVSNVCTDVFGLWNLAMVKDSLSGCEKDLPIFLGALVL